MRSVSCRKIYLPSLFLTLVSYLLCSAVLGGGLGAHAQEHESPHALTNEDVIKMVRAHLGTGIIVAQIRDNPGTYSLTTDKLIQLKELGVPDTVISAMQAKAADSTTGPASRGPYTHPRPKRPDAGTPAEPASRAQENHPASVPVRLLTGQPGGTETFTPQTCPRLGTDDTLLLNFLRIEPRALDDEATLRQFVKLNNKCERQFTDAQIQNELEYPQIAKAYKDKAAEILSGVPSEITLQSYGLAFGQYDAKRAAFPLDSGNDLLLKLGRGYQQDPDWTSEKVEFSPGSTLFPDSYRPFAFLKLTWTPFIVHELPMSEPDAKQFLAKLLQDSAATKARLDASIFNGQNIGLQGVSLPDTTRTVYPVAIIKILPTPPRIIITTNPGGGGSVQKSFTVELSGQISELSILKYLPASSRENPPLAVMHPDPTVSDTEQQAEAFYFKQQYGRALPLAERACKAGYPRACGLEGFLLAFGLGGTADAQQGVSMIYDSCENLGDAATCYLSALAFQKMGKVTLVDSNGGRHEAFESDFTKSCSEGFPDACFQLAKSNYNEVAQRCGGENCPALQRAWQAFDSACGIGIQRSTTECDEDVPFACENLALCYLRGAGVSRDSAKAKQLFEHGCSLGDKEQCKEAQSGVFTGNAETSTGAGQGSASSDQNAPPTAPVPHSGIMGRSFSKNLADCNAGKAGACNLVGFSLIHGWGVDRNLSMAKYYYEKSCTLGSREGCSEAKDIPVN